MQRAFQINVIWWTTCPWDGTPKEDLRWFTSSLRVNTVIWAELECDNNTHKVAHNNHKPLTSDRPLHRNCEFLVLRWETASTRTVNRTTKSPILHKNDLIFKWYSKKGRCTGKRHGRRQREREKKPKQDAWCMSLLYILSMVFRHCHQLTIGFHVRRVPTVCHLERLANNAARESELIKHSTWAVHNQKVSGMSQRHWKGELGKVPITCYIERETATLKAPLLSLSKVRNESLAFTGPVYIRGCPI